MSKLHFEICDVTREDLVVIFKNQTLALILSPSILQSYDGGIIDIQVFKVRFFDLNRFTLLL